MNKTMLIGRLTSAPEISKTTNDKSYVRVTLAVNRRFKMKKENERQILFQLLFGENLQKL
jgi:single-strand DNA-binding protein